jgi:hypothetical protein
LPVVVGPASACEDAPLDEEEEDDELPLCVVVVVVTTGSSSSSFESVFWPGTKVPPPLPGTSPPLSEEGDSPPQATTVNKPSETNPNPKIFLLISGPSRERVSR